MSLIQPRIVETIEDVLKNAKELSERDNETIHDDKPRNVKYPIYFIELINDRYILRGRNVNFIISNIDDCGFLKITMHFKKIYNKKAHFKYIKQRGRSYAFQLYDYKTKKLICEFKLSRDIEECGDDADKVIRFNSDIFTLRCMCGYPSSANYQDAITYLCHNLDNINYNSHDINIRFNTPRWYVRFGKTDSITGFRAAIPKPKIKIYRYL